ncbi:MAG: hypothetical protein ACYSOJ_01315 [Planctomycetota bacterium]|jgi:cell division protein FtsB
MGEAVGGAAQAGAQVATAAMQIAYAEKQAKRAREREKKLKGEMETVKSQRPDIINPYEGITDLSDTFADLSGLVTDQSGKAVDMSGSFSNPFANVGVATEAAEFQAEQADISLANTLDTLAATGASAGGATALAQAALASKKGISADIQKQEQQNASVKAKELSPRKCLKHKDVKLRCIKKANVRKTLKLWVKNICLLRKNVELLTI